MFLTGDEEWLKNIVAAVGPVAISICVEASFMDYQSGIYDVPGCCTENNHAPMVR